MDAPLIDLLIAKGATWCPTIYIYSRGGRNSASTDLRASNFKLAVEKGAKIVYGTDIGGYAWTESETADFPYMVKWGMTPMQAIQSATSGALRCSISRTGSDRLKPGSLPILWPWQEIRSRILPHWITCSL